LVLKKQNFIYALRFIFDPDSYRDCKQHLNAWHTGS
jgi:hypothetical protein